MCKPIKLKFNVVKMNIISLKMQDAFKYNSGKVEYQGINLPSTVKSIEKIILPIDWNKYPCEKLNDVNILKSLDNAIVNPIKSLTAERVVFTRKN